MEAINFSGSHSLVEIVILGFITMNMALSGFYVVHHSLKKVTASQAED